MQTHRNNNLKVNSAKLGILFIEPSYPHPKDIQNAKVVIYPAPIKPEWIRAAVEWAAGTQVPFFCHVGELSRLKKEGFGAYRFQKLDAYKEVDFLSGAIEFFPSRVKKEKNFKGWLQELKEILGMKTIPGFHLIIKPKNEAQVVFLSHPYLDHIEWSLLTRGTPLAIIGSTHFAREEWQMLAKKFKSTIFYSGDVLSVDTDKKKIEFVEDAETALFNVIQQKTKITTKEIDTLA